MRLRTCGDVRDATHHMGDTLRDGHVPAVVRCQLECLWSDAWCGLISGGNDGWFKSQPSSPLVTLRQAALAASLRSFFAVRMNAMEIERVLTINNKTTRMFVLYFVSTELEV